MFRYIKGVRFWQITEWLPRNVNKVLKHPHNGPLIVGMISTMAAGVLGFLVFAYIGRSGGIRFNLSDASDDEQLSILLLVMAGIGLPLMTFMIGLLQFPVYMERRKMLRDRILKGDREFRPFLMRDNEPIFGLLMPRWLVERYLKDLKREDVPIKIKNMLLDYYSKATAIELEYKEIVANAEDRVEQIEAMYQYVVRLTQLAQSYTPVFEEELGVIYGLEYFDDRYALYRKERDAQLRSYQDAVIEVTSTIDRIASGYKATIDRLSVMLAE